MLTANNDTFYMSAVVIPDEPFVLSVPDTADRYYVNVINMWQELEHYIGRRTTGTKAARYVLAPPSEVYIYDLAVVEAHRREGIATALIVPPMSSSFKRTLLMHLPSHSTQSLEPAKRCCTSISRYLPWVARSSPTKDPWCNAGCFMV
jgi:hypothetical protein